MFVIVATWTEPEDGVAVWGPLHTEEAATACIPLVEPELHNDGILPDDVTIEVQRMSPVPGLVSHLGRS